MVVEENTDTSLIHLPKNWQSFRNWLTTDLGKYVLEQETKVLKRVLASNVGSNVLILGEPNFCDSTIFLHEQGKKINQFVVHPALNATNQTSEHILVVGRQDKLPINSDSMDVVILPHALEIISNPYEALRESYRVLRPEGKIIITGFSLFSVWGIWKIIAKILFKAPWSNNFFCSGKLLNWLELLDFDEFVTINYCHTLPINSKYMLHKLRYLEKIGNFLPFIFGNIYTVSACKRVIPLTPCIIGEWGKKPLDSDLVKPALKG